MSIIICGSIAFDNIMVFPGRFKDHINSEQIHILNVSFLVDQMRQGFGGCAANIAYGLTLLGVDAKPMATVGRDFSEYAGWLQRHGISQAHIHVIDEAYTARAFITTDLDNNQIAVFHPGAMNQCHQVAIPRHEKVSMGLISPEGRAGMLVHARQFIEQGIPYLFDPGQGVALFNKEEMLFFIRGATWLACNDYEFKVIQKTTGLSLQVLSQQVDAMFVTCGSKGSTIYAGKEKIEIPVVVPAQVRDPTGCGDAYRAGILFGLLNNLSLETAGHIASLMGSIQVEQEGTQSYSFTLDDFSDLFEKRFSYAFPV